MKKLKNNSAFTLIEIIVALIIIGILAAIALPNIFSNVQKSNAATAIAAMDGIKTSVEACAAQNNVTPTTNSASTPICNIASFGLTTTNGFTFDIASAGTSHSTNASSSGYTVAPSGTPSGGNLTYSIIATDTSENTISLTRETTGSFTCSAPQEGVYEAVCTGPHDTGAITPGFTAPGPTP